MFHEVIAIITQIVAIANFFGKTLPSSLTYQCFYKNTEEGFWWVHSIMLQIEYYASYFSSLIFFSV